MATQGPRRSSPAAGPHADGRHRIARSDQRRFRGTGRHGPRRAERIRAGVVVEHETRVGTMGRFRRPGRPRRSPELVGRHRQRGGATQTRTRGTAMSGRIGEAFLEQITANVDDDATRLVFSDWLEEQGELERAEFIRVQVQRASLPPWDAAQVGLKIREQELLKQHGETWLKEMPEIPGVRWEGFRRGIVAVVSFVNFDAMRTSAHACRAIAPIEAVRVHWPRRKESTVNVPQIAELRELTLTGRPYGNETARLADSPQLATLRVLKALGLEAAELGQLAG